MAARDNLSKVQFRQDKADRDYDTDSQPDPGQDSNEKYGYSADDSADYLYKRAGNSGDIDPKDI